MRNNNKYILAAALLGLAACKPNLKGTDVSKGSADFTKYVSVGNSLDAGFTDGAVFVEGQENSFPRMLAQQFKLAGGGDFKTPYMNAGNGNDASNQPRLVLKLVNGSLAPVRDTPATAFNNVSAAGPYNHCGVPGIRAIDALFPTYSGINPFLTRFCQTPGTSTLISEAMRNSPTFFTLWLGANDVLGWSTGGGTGPVLPENNTTPWVLPGALINPNLVVTNIATAVNTLTASGSKGVLATIPYVNSTPYFTTVPFKCIPLTRQGQVDTLNAGYAQLIAINPDFKWVLGANAPVMVDSSVPLVYRRKVTAEDYIVLPASTVLATGGGTLFPLVDQWVLDKTEAALATDYTKKYNDGIKALAESKGLALADMNAYMSSFKSGIVYNAVAMNANFATGGAFGLDGVHPTPKGYALIANEFIRVINAKYGSTIPAVDVNKYRGVKLP